MTIHTRQIFIGILTFLAIGAFGVLYIRAFHYYPSDEVALSEEAENQLIASNLAANGDTEEPDTSPKPKTQADLAASVPAAAKTEVRSSSMRIVIPKIKVNTKIQEVGLTKSGNMASPNNFSEVGWYKYGTVPGKKGSAVMAGHVDNGIAFPAVFKNLEDLKLGDDIYVDMKDGTRLHYKVVTWKTYPYDSAPAEVFNDNSGKLLKLITCTGKIIKELRTHSQRLVVTASLVE